MKEDILTTLEQRVAKAIGMIQSLNHQINTLTQENRLLKQEQDEWRKELTNLIQKLDKIEIKPSTPSIVNDLLANEIIVETEETITL